MYAIICHRCRITLNEDPSQVACPTCRGPIDFQYSESLAPWDAACGSMWKYRQLLPVRSGAAVVSMHEGGTPLEPVRMLADAQVYIKNETVNPTGSHKDRALSIGVTKALEFGRDTVMLYSDGSTALSSAAYAARAGLKSVTVVGRDTPDFRLLPLVIYNSHVLEYQGTGAQALHWVHQVCQHMGIYETSTYRLANPYEAEGPKTIGLEIVEQLGRPPDWLVVPVGGGGTLAGIWRAFVDLQARGRISSRPRLVGVLPEGYNMLELGMERGVQSDADLNELAPAEAPRTIQAKIAMTFPPDGLEAIAAVRESSGMFLYASDREAIQAQQELGSRAGVYAEPSAAVAIAGVEKLLSLNQVGTQESIVAVITGSGFRETGAIAGGVPLRKTPVDTSSGVAALERILGR